MILKRVNAVSCAKIMGLLYAIFGFLAGLITALISLLGGVVSGTSRTGGVFAIFGVGAIILFPLLYGAIGFVITWISAAIYNLLAKAVGGIEIEVAPLPGLTYNTIAGSNLPQLDPYNNPPATM